MPGIFSWTLPSVYGRTRRLQMPPFLARTDTNVSRAATAMAAGNPGDAVINMDPAADKQDTLFGPNVGIMSSGPRWTESVGEKTPDVDELTPEIVKGWIDKSKEPVQPTTTLQALVNLKRPTLRLTPLHSEAGDAQGADQHALEFAYDSDAPRCAITVTTVHDAGRTVVFEGTFDGGFGRVLSLADGATIDLARFDTTADVTASTSATPAQASALPIASTNSHEPATPTQRRFTMPFRRRPRSIAGPAIAVLDAETPAAIPGEAADNKAKEKEEDEGGVRALIRLVALDADGVPVQPANEQTTYLHVVRYGIRASGDEEDTRPWVVKVVKREATIGPHTFHLHEIYGLSSAATTTPAAAPTAPLPSSATYPPTASPTTAAAAAPAHEDEPSSECLLCLSAAREVVLLPCRHLVACKECAINMVEFGAGGQIVHNEEGATEGETSAAGAGASAETTPDPNAGAETAASASAPAAESPVTDAGAAGTLTAGAHAGSPEGAAVGESAQGSPAVAIAPVPTTTQPRRKRRAKGWFCPVCRQPYTSLLRITTVPPASGGKDGKRVSTSTVDHPLSPPAPAVIHNHGRATAQDAARQV